LRRTLRDVDVVLPEPARQQLLTLAADLVGRMPSNEVPPALRAIARFTPAKRRQLGGVALAGALDSDEGFRERVASAVADVSPALVEALATGGSTAASDPIDVIVVAYLTRPDQWQEIVEKERTRWAAENEGTSDEAELGRLHDELVSLRAAARSESARMKQAIAAAVAEVSEELADARRALRDRTRELRAAERDRDDVIAARDEAIRKLDANTAAQDAELRRLKARIGELERAGESARRDSRSERDLDDARLWLLTESLVQAASGLRRELSLSRPDLVPADAVAAENGATHAEASGHGITSAATLDRVLATPNVHLIVDGYNVTKTGYGDAVLADQRSRLMGQLAGLAARAQVEVTIAFDGAHRPMMQPTTPRGVRVLFSRDEIADDLIRRLVAAEPAGRTVVVATSDQQIVTDVSRSGAWTVPAQVLLALLG